MKKFLFIGIFISSIIFSCSSDDQPQPNPESEPEPEVELSSQNNITELVLENNGIDYLTSISSTNITINNDLPYGTEEMTIKSLKVSEKAEANITAGETKNLSNGSFEIIVTAENNESKKYIVTATFEERTFNVTVFDPVTVSKTYNTPTYAHYMPWFESPEYAEFPQTDKGNWGLHWTMANKNPLNIDANGKREIASHYYPLIGPYDNGEPDYLEYAVVCMKLSGLDGILIDNPGITDVYDGRLLQDHTDAIIPWLEKAGLQYALVYEDSALKNAEEQGIISNRVQEAKRVIAHMETNYFSSNSYIKVDNKPLLLNFGPQAIFTEAEWLDVFSGLSEKPIFIPLPYRNLGAAAEGEFGWVDESINNNFYQRCIDVNLDVCIGGAMPGFDDYYQEGGWGNGFTFYDDRNGQLFKESLDRAKLNDITMLQIITWNDWGEGTIIEPSEEFGYDRLTVLQEFLGVSYTENDVSLAVDLYQKRKEYKDDSYANQVMDQVFYYLISLQIEKARDLLKQL
ncbi:glycoside hydrolase family 71/99-like protein [Aquimarina gracilis]|uniref:Glycoside hydrolase family 71/99-like protein n=1 Tax=Aquimarina gracilis TaxID=874422 RepID=A0ABU5ZZB5_9FLAO|nr:glycoside hydrolase family 71/99-like protein [Aquimarina gracilis]MEB3347233.1 glycoside hydrolase family 71/99-like protein [Aquimarina gracilis]